MILEFRMSEYTASCISIENPSSIYHQNKTTHEIKDIDILQQFGINVADISKLKSGGINTIRGLKMTTRKKLSEIKGISDGKIEKLKEAANKIEQNEFVTGMEFSVKREAIFKISTGSEEFDKILGGGFESMSISECFGEFRTGKTQLAHTLCVTAQMPGMNHTGGKVAYIDTEGTFRPDRLRSIAARFNLDANAILNNIVYAKAHNHEHQCELVDLVTAQFYQEPGVFKLLIIDSIIALFRVDFQGRAELADRQQKLNKQLAQLQKISEEYNIAVYLTNQMTSDPGAALSFVSDPKKPVGGHVLAHASATRVMLKKGRGEMRIAKIYDSPDMPESEAPFMITEGGVADPND